MATPNLIFNILTFDWPEKNPVLYFRKTQDGHCQTIHKSIFPNNIESIFPGIRSDGTKVIYTTFTGEREGFTPLSIDFKKENPNFIKRYYDRKINYYFRAIKKQIVKVGFIKENQIWLPLASANTDQFDIYEKYSLKV